MTAPDRAAPPPMIYAADALDSYLHCGRQYEYGRVFGFDARITPGVVGQYSRCLWGVLWAVVADGLAAHGARARFAAAWTEAAIPETEPYAPIYRAAGERAVTHAADIVAAGNATAPHWTVALPNGRHVALRPDCVLAPAGGMSPTVQWWRTGDPRTSHLDHNRLALYHAAARAAFPGMEPTVQIVYLASGKVASVDYRKIWQRNSLTRYANAIERLERGLFSPNRDDYHCPRCPYYLICPREA